MGRSAAPPPLDLDTVRQTIALRQDGALIRIQSRMSAFSGEPAVFQNMVAFRHDGVTRRIAAPRVAYALSVGAWPPRGGQVRLRTGDSDYRIENLEVVPALQHRPHGKGGKSSALTKRQAADTALLQTMVSHPGAGVEQLGKLVGTSKARTCSRLGKLAKQGPTRSPMCVPGRSWLITAQGRTVAMGEPLLDALDRDILGTLAQSAMGPVRLSRRVGVCLLTVTRRCRLLVGRGLVFADVRRFYEITEAGRRALGPAAAPKPWVRVEAISAAAGREVLERGSVDDRAKGGRPKGGAWTEAALTRERLRA